MNFLDTYKKEIERLCASHKVKTLHAFGSVLRPDFNKESDIDFVVNFDSMDVTAYADNYFDFKFALQKIFNRSVDLLEEKAIRNPYLKQSIDQQRRLIYGY